MKRICCLLLTIGALVLIYGCGRTQKQIDELKESEERAKEYYREKYKEDVVIAESDYSYTAELFGRSYDYSKIEYVTDAGEYIIWDGEYRDNHQAREIHAALDAYTEDKIWNGKNHYFQGENVYNAESVKAANEVVELYHDYFDGDAEKYLKENEVRLASMYGIASDESDLEEVAKRYQESFACTKIRLYVTDSDTLKKVREQEDRVKQGDIAVKQIYVINADEIDSMNQTYIQAFPGIYFLGEEIELTEGDIVFEKMDMTEEELETLWSGYSDKKYIFEADSDIYIVKLSKRVQQAMAELGNTKLKLRIYMEADQIPYETPLCKVNLNDVPSAMQSKIVDKTPLNYQLEGEEFIYFGNEEKAE